MTFRDELTSATDLDTTAGAGSAGVIIAGARATWQDGQAGMGYIEATSSSASVVGSEFHAVGSTGGNLSPEWSMTCEGLPAGGYQSVLTLTADVVRVGGQVPLTEPTYDSPTLFTRWAVVGDPNNLRYEKDAGGFVHLAGLVRSLTAGGWGAANSWFTLPPGCRPAADRFFILPTAQSTYAFFLVKIASTGVVTWAGTLTSSSATFSYTANSWVCFDGVTFRGAQ